MINAPFPTPIPIAIQPQGMLQARTLQIPFKFESPAFAVPLLNNDEIHNNNNNMDRKRKRVQETMLETETTVKLSRDDLLKFSSKEYEDYVRNISKNKPLSPSEQREVKRQRRLIKNREYAQTSRNKKKEQVGQMETQLQILTSENDSLHTQVSTLHCIVQKLEESNQALLEENNKLKGILGTMTGLPPELPPGAAVPAETFPPFSTSPSRSPTWSTDDSSEVDLFIPSLVASSDSEDSTSMSPTEPVPPLYDSDVLDVDPFSVSSFEWSSNLHALTFLIVLFSFGIFFNGMSHFTHPSFVPIYPEPTVPAASVPAAVAVYEMDMVFEKTHYRSLFEWVEEEFDVPSIFPSNTTTTCPSVPLSMSDVLMDEASELRKLSFSEAIDQKYNNNNNNNNNNNKNKNKNNNNNNNNNNNMTELAYQPVSYTATVLVEV